MLSAYKGLTELKVILTIAIPIVLIGFILYAMITTVIGGLLVSLASFTLRTAFNVSPRYTMDSVSSSDYGGGYMMEESMP